MHHIKQRGTAIQIAEFWCLPNFPCQQANSSTTVFGITQWMPNNVNTIDHKSKAIEQWMRRWSTNSPFLLHIQHQSKIKIYCFLRLSIVKIIPKAAVHTKKSNSRGDLRLPNSLPRERLIETFCQHLVIRTNSKTSSHSKFPTHLIIPNSFQRSSINSRH